MNLLDIKNLSLEVETPQGIVKAIDKASLQVKDGEIHGLMGESGSGKSLIAKAIIGVINPRWKLTADRFHWCGKDLLNLAPSKRRQIMRNEMAFVPQDASSSLDPTATIKSQLEEVFENQAAAKSADARTKHKQELIQLLHKVGIKDHDFCLSSYPGEISDDMCQKLVIAMALAKKPRLLIADEPCSKMEIIAQQSIFKLIQNFNSLHEMSILLVSHDIALLSNFATSLTVMYCGQTVESGNAKKIYEQPLHPYTHALVNTNITLNSNLKFKSPLPTLKGTIPTLQHLPIGCRLGPRCPDAQKACVKTPPTIQYSGQSVQCHFPITVKGDASQ